MTRKEFEEIIREAVEGLPAPLREKVDNITFAVARRSDGELYGLYEGVPFGERGPNYNMALPDRITLYQDAIERDFPEREGMIRCIRETVLHELGHYFGLDDEELDGLGIG